MTGVQTCALPICFPVTIRGLELDCELRYDLLVDDTIVVELKTVEELIPIHEAQLLTYLKMLKKPKGILINFNCTNIFKEGQRSVPLNFRGLELDCELRYDLLVDDTIVVELKTVRSLFQFTRLNCSHI